MLALVSIELAAISCEVRNMNTLNPAVATRNTDSRVEKASLQLLGLRVELKNEQREGIRAFVSGRDVFVALPTTWIQQIFLLRPPPS